jgi:tetratricopeptide (TPR) repeat protein
MKNFLLVVLLSAGVIACNETAEKTIDTTEESSTQKEVKEDSLGWVNTQILENPNRPDLYMAKARYMLRKGNVEKAVEEANKAIGLDSSNVAYRNFKADAYYDAQDLLNAKNVYMEVLEKDETNMNANKKMAWISLIAGQHESCFSYANDVLKQNQYLPEPYYLKGLAYKELGNFKLAVSNFRTATEQDNDYLEAWLQLGYMYEVAEDTLAGAFFENALRIDSNNIDALYAFGVHLQQWGIAYEAIDQYQHIIRVNNSYHNAYYNIGFIYLELLEQNDSAIKYYDKVVTLNPYNYKGYYNRGLAFERNNQFPQALMDYDKTLELKPDYTPAAKGKSRVK